MLKCTLSIFVPNTVTKIKGQTRYFSNSVQACEHLMNTYILTFFAFYHWPFILAAWFKLSLAFLLWNSFNPHIKAVSTLAHFCKIVNIQVIIKLLLLLLFFFCFPIYPLRVVHRLQQENSVLCHEKHYLLIKLAR